MKSFKIRTCRVNTIAKRGCQSEDCSMTHGPWNIARWDAFASGCVLYLQEIHWEWHGSSWQVSVLIETIFWRAPSGRKYWSADHTHLSAVLLTERHVGQQFVAYRTLISSHISSFSESMASSCKRCCPGKCLFQAVHVIGGESRTTAHYDLGGR